MTPFSEKQLTLGEMIELLRKLPADHPASFAFCRLRPTSLRSYRGFYDHLALGFGEPGTMPVGDLLTELRTAHGHKFEGYKGGSYRMRNDTPMWADNWGDASSTAIVGIKADEYDAMILTEHIEI